MGNWEGIQKGKREREGERKTVTERRERIGELLHPHPLRNRLSSETELIEGRPPPPNGDLMVRLSRWVLVDTNASDPVV